MFDVDLVGKQLTYKKYKKLMRSYKRKFIKKCKSFDVWDWEMMHELLVFIISWMKDFYCENPDSFATEEWIEKRREEFEIILNCNKRYVGFESLSCKSNLLSNKSTKHLTKIGNTDAVGITVETVNEELKDQSDKYMEMSNEAFEKFYKYIGKFMRNWWD